MAGERRVVKHDRAERPVNEVERFAMIESRFVERFAFLGDAISGVDENAAARAEGKDVLVVTGRRGLPRSESRLHRDSLISQKPI